MLHTIETGSGTGGTARGAPTFLLDGGVELDVTTIGP